VITLSLSEFIFFGVEVCCGVGVEVCCGVGGSGVGVGVGVGGSGVGVGVGVGGSGVGDGVGVGGSGVGDGVGVSVGVGDGVGVSDITTISSSKSPSVCNLSANGKLSIQFFFSVTLLRESFFHLP